MKITIWVIINVHNVDCYPSLKEKKLTLEWMTNIFVLRIPCILASRAPKRRALKWGCEAANACERLPKQVLALVKDGDTSKLGVHSDLKPKFNRLTREIKQCVISHNSRLCFLRVWAGEWHQVTDSSAKWTRLEQTAAPKANLFADPLEDTFRGQKSVSFAEQYKTNIDRKTKSRLLNARKEEFKPVTLVEQKRQVGRLGLVWVISAWSEQDSQNDGQSSSEYVSVPPCATHQHQSQDKHSSNGMEVTMIHISDCQSRFPKNFRPIFVTCCLSKIVERFIQARIYAHLEQNNKLVPMQSGFRRFRRNTNNLVYLKKRLNRPLAEARGPAVCSSTFRRPSTMCGIYVF